MKERRSCVIVVLWHFECCSAVVEAMETPVVPTISRPSRMPSYRIQDLRYNISNSSTPSDDVSPALQNSLHRLAIPNPLRLGESLGKSSIWSGSEERANNAKIAGNAAKTTSTHNRTNSANLAATPNPNRPRLLPRSISFPLPSASSSPSSPAAAVNIDLDARNHDRVLSSPHEHHVNATPHQQVPTVTKQQKARVFRRHNNGIEKGHPSRPPPAMITQGSYKLEIDTTSTTDWVASQQIAPSPLSSRSQPPPSPAQPTSARSFDSSGSRPLIKPIRAFKPSSRKSTDMAFRRISGDADNTLRALEGYDRPARRSNSSEQDTSDDSDLFLRAAREEELLRHASNGPVESLSKRVSYFLSLCIDPHQNIPHESSLALA